MHYNDLHGNMVFKVSENKWQVYDWPPQDGACAAPLCTFDRILSSLLCSTCTMICMVEGSCCPSFPGRPGRLQHYGPDSPDVTFGKASISRLCSPRSALICMATKDFEHSWSQFPTSAWQAGKHIAHPFQHLGYSLRNVWVCRSMRLLCAQYSLVSIKLAE